MLTRNLRGLLLYVMGVGLVCLMIEVKRRSNYDYYTINKEPTHCQLNWGLLLVQPGLSKISCFGKSRTRQVAQFFGAHLLTVELQDFYSIQTAKPSELGTT